MDVDIASLVTLPNMLSFLAAGGAAYIVLWLLDRDSPWLSTLNAEQKRYAAYVGTGLLAFTFYLLKTWLARDAFPVDLRDWLMTAWAVGAPAAMMNQLLHARFSMKK